MKLSLYIHIPFCIKKCNYCDFLSFPIGEKKDLEWEKQYLKHIIEEIRAESILYRDDTVDTIFIGGGTPSVLETEQLKEIMDTVYENFSIEEGAEISVEVNPGTVTEEKLYAYRQSKINRLSIGLQSLKEDELKLLGRIHGREDFFRCYEAARKVGFKNINVDLISSLPGQTWQNFEETLTEVIKLRPQHISSYSLIVEENTPFYEWYGGEKGDAMLPSEEEDRKMYYETRNHLEKQGYLQYEISNYALPGFACKHNLGYWSGKNYVGFGLGASSMVNLVRWKNTSSIKEYLSDSDIKREINPLSLKQQMEEFMFLGLRKTIGVSVKEFAEKFSKKMEMVYGGWLRKMKTEGLLQGEEQIALTNKGMDLANYVMAGFLLEEE